jgi:hypothetical protein
MKRLPAIRWRTSPSFGMLALVVGLLGCGGIACACNVPVFRYALERWQPDPYRVVLFHRGELTDAQRALLHPLEEASSDEGHANVMLRLVDVDDLKDVADRTLFDAQSPSELPWLVVQYPRELRKEKPVWAGPLSDNTPARLVDSPLRKELIHRLADGQTAVWLMLECGQAEKDDAVAALLADELARLAQRLQLPELTSAPEDALLSTAPLQVTFSLMRVPRGDLAEQSLVEMMLGSEPDLTEFDEPMVFPVFGRGRALLPLIGAGITPDNIHESAAFLVGACSCEVKDLNPGFDLLLAASWDVLLFKEAPPAEVLAARATVSSGKPELVAIPTGMPSTTRMMAEPESSAGAWFGSNIVASIALVSVVLVFFVVIVFKRFA